MYLSKFCNFDSEPFTICLSKGEFLHLYDVICALLHLDDSDKFLVELERRMIDIL